MLDASCFLHPQVVKFPPRPVQLRLVLHRPLRLVLLPPRRQLPTLALLLQRRRQLPHLRLQRRDREVLLRVVPRLRRRRRRRGRLLHRRRRRLRRRRRGRRLRRRGRQLCLDLPLMPLVRVPRDVDELLHLALDRRQLRALLRQQLVVQCGHHVVQLGARRQHGRGALAVRRWRALHGRGRRGGRRAVVRRRRGWCVRLSGRVDGAEIRRRVVEVPVRVHHLHGADDPVFAAFVLIEDALDARNLLRVVPRVERKHLATCLLPGREMRRRVRAHWCKCVFSSHPPLPQPPGSRC